jgi:transcriptional regulator with PAS, ATPase and Fis domain
VRTSVVPSRSRPGAARLGSLVREHRSFDHNHQRAEFEMGIAEMMGGLNTAIVACDAEFKVTYANPKCKQVFKDLLQMENFVGNNMAACHKPETMGKLEKLFADYREKKKKLDYYTMDGPAGKLTIVNVPTYEGDRFTGVVEFIFESSLA